MHSAPGDVPAQVLSEARLLPRHLGSLANAAGVQNMWERGREELPGVLLGHVARHRQGKAYIHGMAISAPSLGHWPTSCSFVQLASV